MTGTYDTTKLKEITKNSDKVYFVCANDFYYYYYGGYIPQGTYSPYYSWIFKKDLERFLKGLIEDGYYVVTPEDQIKNEQEILGELGYKTMKKDGFMVVGK